MPGPEDYVACVWIWAARFRVRKAVHSAVISYGFLRRGYFWATRDFQRNFQGRGIREYVTEIFDADCDGEFFGLLGFDGGLVPSGAGAQGTQAAQSGAGTGSASVTGAKTATPAAAQSPLQKTIEAYVRNLYAFGPDVEVTVTDPKDAGMAGLLETSSLGQVLGGNNEDAKFFHVSKDGMHIRCAARCRTCRRIRWRRTGR